MAARTPITGELAERLAMAMAIIQGLRDEEPEPNIEELADAFVADTAAWMSMDTPE